jgi:hypothetical protein
MRVQRIVLAFLLCAGIVLRTDAQPGDRYLDAKYRVLDILFPTTSEQRPYSLKIVMRFGDSCSQLNLVEGTDGGVEVTEYSLASKTAADVEKYIAQLHEARPDISDREVASQIQVTVKKWRLPPQKLQDALTRLSGIRLSPALDRKACMDGCNEYEFWYDDWLEAAHFTLVSPSKNSPSWHLVDWMKRFQIDADKSASVSQYGH